MRSVESLCPWCTAQCEEPQTSSVHVANIGHPRFNNYVIVRLNGLELRHQRRFLNVVEHMRCFEGWNWDFRLVPTSRGTRPPTIFLACKLREKSSIVELVLRLSECNNHLNRVGVDLPDEIVMFTIENYSISRDDRLWFSWFGSRDHLDDLRDVCLSGSS